MEGLLQLIFVYKKGIIVNKTMSRTPSCDGFIHKVSKSCDYSTDMPAAPDMLITHL